MTLAVFWLMMSVLLLAVVANTGIGNRWAALVAVAPMIQMFRYAALAIWLLRNKTTGDGPGNPDQRLRVTRRLC